MNYNSAWDNGMTLVWHGINLVKLQNYESKVKMGRNGNPYYLLLFDSQSNFLPLMTLFTVRNRFSLTIY